MDDPLMQLLNGQHRIESALQALAESLEEVQRRMASPESPRAPMVRISCNSQMSTGCTSQAPSAVRYSHSSAAGRSADDPCTDIDKKQSMKSMESDELIRRRSRATTTACSTGKLVAYTLPRSWPASLPVRGLSQANLMAIEPSTEACMSSRNSDESGQAQTEQTMSIGMFGGSALLSDADHAGSVNGDAKLVSKVRCRWPERWTIDPSSTFGMAADLFCLVVLAIDMALIPYVLAWDVPIRGNAVQYMMTFTMIFWTLDIPRSFITCYHEDGTLETRLRAIATNYLKTWFLVDAAVVCSDWVSMLLNSASTSMKMLRLAKLSRMLRILGVVRMLRFMRVMEDFVERSLSDRIRFAIRILKILVGILWATHVMSCAWFAIGKWRFFDEKSWIDTQIGNGQTFEDMHEIYQYLSAFHWAVAQLTLGAVDIVCSNALERFFNIVCLLVGLLFGSALISSLSATMVELHSRRKEQTHKLRLLRRFLRENLIEAKLANVILRQVTMRLRQQPLLTEKDVPALTLLSQSLRADLSYAIFEPCVLSHPLFRLWSNVDVGVLQNFCTTSVKYLFLSVQDDLFSPGAKADQAYYVQSGALEYKQEPGTSPIMMKMVTEVDEGSWLCEAALWAEWIHVGQAVAKTPCKLVTVHAEGIIRAMSRHALIEEVTRQYGKSFQQRLLAAEPPNAAWPSDLEVPNTEFADIVISMTKEVQMTIGQMALQKLSKERNFRKLERRGAGVRERIKQGIHSAKTILIESDSGEVQRVVSDVVMHIEDSQQNVLVQLGRLEAGELRALFQLPQGKQDACELAEDTMNRLLASRLPWMTGYVEVQHQERELTYLESPEFGVRTRYCRTNCYAVLDLMGNSQAPVCKAARPQEPTNLSTALLQRDVYVAKRRTSSGFGEVVFYTFLGEREFDHLNSTEGQADLLEWMGLLKEPARAMTSMASNADPETPQSTSMHDFIRMTSNSRTEASDDTQRGQPPAEVGVSFRECL